MNSINLLFGNAVWSISLGSVGDPVLSPGTGVQDKMTSLVPGNVVSDFSVLENILCLHLADTHPYLSITPKQVLAVLGKRKYSIAVI